MATEEQPSAALLLRGFFRVGGRFDGRLLLLLALALYAAAVWHWTSTAGWERAWVHLRVPAMTPNFVDGRAVLASYDRFRAGAPMDQVQSPPSNGAKIIPITYPRTWLIFSYLGLGEKHIYPVELALIAACFGLSMLYIGRLTLGQSLPYLPVMISPSLMLLIERGNADLLIYLMVLAACWLFGRKVLAPACAVIFTAAMLKIYPVAALAPALTKRGRIIFGIFVVLFLAFCFLDRHDLAWVSRNTPREWSKSFGAFVMTDAYGLSRFIGLAIAGVLAVIAAAIAVNSSPWPVTDDTRGAGFLAGASILVLCFVIGNNYMYRWWYALLLMPQLMRWIDGETRHAQWAAWMLLGIVLTTWATSEPRLWLLGLTLNWLLFGGLVYGLASALLPSAFRRPVRTDQ